MSAAIAPPLLHPLSVGGDFDPARAQYAPWWVGAGGGAVGDGDAAAG